MGAVEILIADDHEIVRRGLISILNASHPEWKIVAEASNGNDAVELGRSLLPNIAILDLSMPGPGGLKVVERLIKSVPGIRILVLTMHSAEPIRLQLKKAGVNAYVVKNEATANLVLAVERILAGEPFFVSAGASRPAGPIEPPEYVPCQFLLTPRELEVMRALALGKSNKEVAHELNLSVRTAESHHANILAKLRADSIGDLAKIAIRDGVI
jgi:DNA-binding NarL/FixJ family response regulator